MSNFIRNRRGFLLAEETIKIIVAVICIVFLVYILVSIYNTNTSAKKIEDGKNVLSRIEAIVSSLEEGASQTQDIPNPEGWHLYSFIGEKKPNLCSGDSCLCVCDNVLIKAISSQEKKCDSKGACLVISNLATSDLDLEIKKPSELVSIQIKKQNGGILIEQVK